MHQPLIESDQGHIYFAPCAITALEVTSKLALLCTHVSFGKSLEHCWFASQQLIHLQSTFKRFLSICHLLNLSEAVDHLAALC